MVTLTIDGKSISVPEGTTVLRAAQSAEIHIPTLCDHPELTPYGGCRLCLVEVEGFRTLQPSCTLPASNNMVVKTDTPRIRNARKFVLSMIFSERNHFCMYCQVSGGDCELQNAAYGEGMTHWNIQPNWKPYPVDASNPFLVLDHNRCILCRRCVRACGELVGNYTLGFEERGYSSFLVADLGVPLGESSCVSCGMCVQVCPTGAIIDRAAAYRGREVQIDHTQTICLGCSLGCGVDVQTRDNGIVRIFGDWENDVNDGLVCKVGRFLPLEEDRERIMTPLIRKDGKLKAATYEEALAAVSTGLAGGNVALLASPRLPAETLQALKSLFVDGLKVKVATSLEEGAFTAAATSLAAKIGAFECTLEDLKGADAVVVFGEDLVETHEVAGFLAKRVAREKSTLVTVSASGNTLDSFARISIKTGKNSLAAALDTPEGAEAAAIIRNAKSPVFIYGESILADAAQLARLVEVARGYNAKLLGVKGAANSLAAAQFGLDKPFVADGVKALFLAAADDQISQRLSNQFDKIGFKVVSAGYHSTVTAAADVVFPAEIWSEIEGHYLTLDGRLQKAVASQTLPDGIRPTAEVLEGIARSAGVESSSADWKAALESRPAPVALRLN